MELSERLEALRKQNDGLSEDELKEAYLEHLADGLLPNEAAKALGKTGVFMRTYRSPKSHRYDSDFAERYQEIMLPEGEHRTALVERARTALAEAAQSGNVRAIEKILMAYDPDFQFLRPAQFTGDVNIDKLLVLMDGVPTPVLQQVRDALAAQQSELPAIEQ